MQIKKRKNNREATKRKIILAGMEIFSKEGYDGATTRAIAETAEANEALIHRYFGNKEGLFFAIIQEFRQQLVDKTPYPEGDSVRAELLNFFKFRMEFSRKQKKFLRMGIAQAILNKRVRDQMQIGIRTPGLLRRLESLRLQGKIHPSINLEHFSLLITGIAFSMSMFTHVISKIDRSAADAALNLAIDLITRGMESFPSSPTLDLRQLSK